MNKEERKERMRRRGQAVVNERGLTGLGKKTILDYSKSPHKMVFYKMGAEKGQKKTIDILPFVITQDWYKKLKTPSGSTTGLDVGDWDYKLELPVHKEFGEEKESFICPKKAFGKKCPACEALFMEWDKEPHLQDEKIIDFLKISWRDHYNVFDYDSDYEGIELWNDQSYYLFEDFLIEAVEESDKGYICFSELDEEGRTIQYKTRQKSRKKSLFYEAHTFSFLDRKPYEESILEKVHPLDKMVVFATYEEIKKALLLSDINKDGDDDDDAVEMLKQEEQTDKRDEKRAVEKNTCPVEGVNIGDGFNKFAECNECSDEVFQKCNSLYAKNQNKEKENNVSPGEENQDQKEKIENKNVCPIKGVKFGESFGKQEGCKQCGDINTELYEACRSEFDCPF